MSIPVIFKYFNNLGEKILEINPDLRVSFSLVSPTVRKNAALTALCRLASEVNKERILHETACLVTGVSLNKEEPEFTIDDLVRVVQAGGYEIGAVWEDDDQDPEQNGPSSDPLAVVAGVFPQFKCET